MKEELEAAIKQVFENHGYGVRQVYIHDEYGDLNEKENHILSFEGSLTLKITNNPKLKRTLNEYTRK